MIDVNKDIRYEDILETAAEVSENDAIAKDGLVLLYYLEPQRHKDLDEHLFYESKMNEKGFTFEHKNLIEVDIGGVKFKFIRNDMDISLINISD